VLIHCGLIGACYHVCKESDRVRLDCVREGIAIQCDGFGLEPCCKRWVTFVEVEFDVAV
jgi:hypothetical protein